MSRNVVFVIKNITLTRLMQSSDLFECFKFIGSFLNVEQGDADSHLSATELLRQVASAFAGNPSFQVVGVIIPDVGAAFLPDHRVWSNGQHWATISDICDAYNAKQESP